MMYRIKNREFSILLFIFFFHRVKLIATLHHIVLSILLCKIEEGRMEYLETE